MNKQTNSQKEEFHHAADTRLLDASMAWYNLVRKHEALKGQTPAMASRLSDSRMDDQRTDRNGSGSVKCRRTTFLLILIVGGCFNATTKPPIKPRPTKSTPVSPKVPFRDSEALKEYLLAKTATAKKGDRIEDVVETIGHSFSTEPYDLGDEFDEIFGTKLIYKIEDPHGMQHEYITFWFGNDDRLIRTSTNIRTLRKDDFRHREKNNFPMP